MKTTLTEDINTFLAEIETVEGAFSGRTDPLIKKDMADKLINAACHKYLKSTETPKDQPTTMYALVMMEPNNDMELKLVNQLQWDYLNSQYSVGTESSIDEIPPKHVRDRIWNDCYAKTSPDGLIIKATGFPQSADEITIKLHSGDGMAQRANAMQADLDPYGKPLQFDSIKAAWAYCIQNNITIKDSYEGHIY